MKGLPQEDFRLFHCPSDKRFIKMLEDETRMSLYHPRNAADARKKLNGGLLVTTFERLIGEDEPQKYMIVIFGALALQLGATIEDKYRNILRGIYHTAGLYAEGRRQLKAALDRYGLNGMPPEPYDFDVNFVEKVTVIPKHGQVL